MDISTVFISAQTKKLLQKKWNYLSVEAKKVISEILKDAEVYQESAVKVAIKSDKNFPQKLEEFIKKNKRKKLSKIEQEENIADFKKLETPLF